MDTPLKRQILFAIVICLFFTIYVINTKNTQSTSQPKKKIIPVQMVPQTKKETPLRQVELQKKKKKKNRLYCMVPYMWTKAHKHNYKERYDEIMRTWGQRCDIIRFFVDPVKVTLPSNVFAVPMRRKPFDIMCSDGKPCKHIWEKIWRSWVWIYDNEIDKAEWFVKVDDDTYLFPENVMDFIDDKGWSYKDPYYFGHKLWHERIPMIAGAVVGFSQATVRKVVPVYRDMPYEDKFEHGTCGDVHGQTEETTTSICLLEKLGIHAEETIDSAGRERITLGEPRATMAWKKGNWWYWKKKPDYVQDGKKCCSPRPIGFHGSKYKTVGEHDLLESIFYQNASLEKWDHRAEGKYFEQVRLHLRRNDEKK